MSKLMRGFLFTAGLASCLFHAANGSSDKDPEIVSLVERHGGGDSLYEKVRKTVGYARCQPSFIEQLKNLVTCYDAYNKSASQSPKATTAGLTELRDCTEDYLANLLISENRCNVPSMGLKLDIFRDIVKTFFGSDNDNNRLTKRWYTGRYIFTGHEEEPYKFCSLILTCHLSSVADMLPVNPTTDKSVQESCGFDPKDTQNFYESASDLANYRIQWRRTTVREAKKDLQTKNKDLNEWKKENDGALKEARKALKALKAKCRLGKCKADDNGTAKSYQQELEEVEKTFEDLKSSKKYYRNQKKRTQADIRYFKTVIRRSRAVIQWVKKCKKDENAEGCL